MAFSAADVKRLREETDAPMMECKQALDEADGDFDRAKAILREKGKAAAAKRSDRKTAAGVVAIARSEDKKTVGAVVLESETDFVARNDDFVAIAQGLAEVFRDHAPGEDPTKVESGGKTVAEILHDAVGKIRENIRLAKVVHMESDRPISVYVHHDRTKGAIVEMVGEASNLDETGFQVAIQTVAFPPNVISKDQLAQDLIDKEIEIETQRAINEGKDAEIAKKAAAGRVNKEFVKRAVLLEQVFYKDQGMTVGDFVKAQSKDGGGAMSVQSFVRLAVGEE